MTEKAETPAADLVAQLRRPSEPSSNRPCTAEGIVLPYFTLINAEGKAVLPEIPADGCGKPRIEALSALNALPYKPVFESPVRQVQSQQSIDTGCDQAWKDLLTIDLNSYKPGPATKVWPAAGQVRVCVYQSEGGIGKLVAGHSVTTDQVSALDSAGPAAPCQAKHTRFATLTADNAQAMAELDGCHRVIRPDQTLGQLDAASVAVLAK
ncbi:hypothetical protein JOF56_010654 [Kibdelosporangium banguiense]|uniref:PknH-like extracellular domain-containing protein n=1 Tax=Kibdelosporangium banguiense TaxID=1365924 RepID=A0ABS4U0T8_9PSEU|nr:hypothetical protein [Kibdelosporangium banguiense]MBP2330269.1 hypothetical protein [Kibdelosporangium banguiense]